MRQPGCVLSTPRTNFSDNCQVVRVRIKRFADNLIGDVRTIKVAGINVIDAQCQRLAQHGYSDVAILGETQDLPVALRHNQDG